MENGQFENSIREALKAKAEDRSVSQERRNQTLMEVHRIAREEKSMKRYAKRKVILITAAICLMTAAGAMAAGKMAYMITTSSSQDGEMITYDQVKTAQGQMGFPVHTVEKFANGAAFQSGNMAEVSIMDDSDKELDKFPQLYIRYGLDGREVTLTVSKPVNDDPARAPLKSEESGGKQLRYYEDKYLFLPENAVPSEEDKKQGEAGKLFISYGSSAEERKIFKSVQWEDQGASYLLFSWEHSEDQLMEMAKELSSIK